MNNRLKDCIFAYNDGFCHLVKQLIIHKSKTYVLKLQII
jgi:hypothetical protein